MIEYKDIRSVHLEISTRCNAACPECPRNFHGVDIIDNYPICDMSLLQAQKIFTPELLQQLDNILINGNYGDFITAKDGLAIVEYFKEQNPNLRIEISTNASGRPNWWERLGELGTIVDFRIDGLADTHHLYRQYTDWHLIMNNAKKFIASGGHAVWSWIPFKHNKHQQDLAETLSKDMGFEKFWVVDAGRDTGPVFDRDRKLSHVIGEYTGTTDFNEAYSKYTDYLNNGELLWSKNNLAPFNSQIKIYEDKFFIIDFSNTLRCFSVKDGKELWNIQTEKSLIRSQKKLSMVIVKGLLYFNNSLGDISAVDINKGELLWQLPTQSSLIYEAAFSLETSDIIADLNTLFFSNNKNQFFSIDLRTGSFNWENKINSSLRPTLIGNYLFTVSNEGYLIVIDKQSGNIIRVTDVFRNFKQKKRNKIKPSGFVIGLNKIYLSTNNGRLIVIDTVSGKTISTLKIDNEKISRPFIVDKNLFVVKDNAIIKLR